MQGKPGGHILLVTIQQGIDVVVNGKMFNMTDFMVVVIDPQRFENTQGKAVTRCCDNSLERYNLSYALSMAVMMHIFAYLRRWFIALLVGQSDMQGQGCS